MLRNIVTWDLGATKCSAGIVQYDTHSGHLVCKKTASIKLKDTSSLEDMIENLEASLAVSMKEVDAVCIGAAGQFDGQTLNHLQGVYPYAMPFAAIAKTRHWPAFAVIHDYSPIVCSTFTSYMEDEANLKRLNTRPMDRFGRRVALGIGTGLGLKDGVLFENGDFWLGRNEMGHIGIPNPPFADPITKEKHANLMHFLHESLHLKQNESVTFEKILSGSGAVRLYEFFHPGEKDITPEKVGKKMCAGEVDELMSTFAWYAGLFVGTVQLIFMPEGGTWITGGVALKNIQLFDRKEFMNGIDASPAYLAQRKEYPLGILCNQEHALIGSGYYAVKRLFDACH